MDFRQLVVFLCVMLWSLNSTSAALYKDYRFGESYSNLSKVAGAYDCTQLMGTKAICLGSQFAGEDVSLVFTFIDERLNAVILSKDFSVDSFHKFLKAISTKFQLIAIRNARSVYDISKEKELHKKSMVTIKNELTEFEIQSMQSGFVAYNFIENKSYGPYAQSLAEQYQLIYEDGRTADIFLEGSSMSVLFTIPKLRDKLVQSLGDSLKAEDF